MRDKSGREITYRHIQRQDDLDLITAMLHESYAPLAQQGLRFLASHQGVETTRLRMSKGETILALDADVIVGTITLKDAEHTSGSPFYSRAEVAGVGQFAVRPSYQRSGIGSTLLDIAERRAAEKGASAIALDTSEHAAQLITFYQSRGYSFVEHVRWADVNYRSVLLAKVLTTDQTIDR